MKTTVFKYLDIFCYGELISDKKDPNWVKPNCSFQSFGYSGNNKCLFFNGGLQDNITSMFGVGLMEFKIYLEEWFKDRYKLPVSNVI
jgi:hypothetical protein